MFGAQSSSAAFATPSSTPAFGTPSTLAFGSSLFSTPFSQPSQPQQQQQTPSLFQTPQPQQQQQIPFGFTTPFNAPSQAQPTPFNNALPATSFVNSQLTTQMAPVAPLPFSLADRDIQAIVDAYKEDPGNPKYAFKHLLFSVTEPQYRIKPVGVSDIMWAEAIAKLEGMESSKRERLWPHLVQGFKDLSQRLKLQDEVILSDSERLKMTQSNVKMCSSKGTFKLTHFLDSKNATERARPSKTSFKGGMNGYLGVACSDNSLSCHSPDFIIDNVQIMRVIEALEGKGSRLPLMKGEVELVEKLAAITRQLKGSGAELSRRVQNLLTLSRLQADGLNGGSVYLPGSTKIHEQSLADMQEVLQRQTEAIARLGNVLKRDMRDMEIIMAEDTEMSDS
ncbi:UNVERIFIED_CONTAM: Nuclear pore complex protein [Sesamum angustifolium]|uniref:Nuclear pore complex protein n=1 Tax=Sesamum angustifolium TaxID=2727405 RepID=A0AAW2QA38_9LAMI